MATVVSVMDRPGWDARTDNIVVVDPGRQRLLWVPRDLWCDSVGNRVNVAYRRGGHGALIAALAEHGVRVEHSLCLAREAVARALESVDVTVPVPAPVEFWYPLHPTLPLEEGRKVVAFSPPEERLRGERVHQWIGARSSPAGNTSDLDRIERQKVFVRRLLEDGFPFASVVADPELVSASGPGAFDDLRLVRPTWRFDTYDDVVPRSLGGRVVLVDRPRRVARAWRRVVPWSRSRRISGSGTGRAP